MNEKKGKKWVYLFFEGSAKMRNLLGGKGANLAEMARIGLPVPPGFTITTEACIFYFKNNKRFPPLMWEQTLTALRKIEKQAGRKFGDPKNPLLVSVRSGARVSMPGMMDTVLNLGLNPETLSGLTRQTNNPRFAFDAYRRFIQMFSHVVLGVEASRFEEALEEAKKQKGVKEDTELSARDLEELSQKFLGIARAETGRDFPQDPLEQLQLAIKAVFDSWNTKRAVDYRNFHQIPHDWGTAVNIVTMVFGNMGEDSGTGVCFTRNPADGKKELFGEYLLNAQGEDVVAGIRTPKKILELKEELPEVYRELVRVCKKLEAHYRDVQDIEFTIEKGRLWMLQTRTAKRTPQAAVKIATDLVGEGLIKKEEAVCRVEPSQVDQLLHPTIDPQAKVRVIARGLNASPGAASGIAVFDADRAEALAEEGKDVILVRPETCPDDVHGMLKARGVLTQHGGATSHAAVVARGLGKPCVAGCEAISINLKTASFTVGEVKVKEGDEISINGTTGEVILGRVPMVEPQISPELKKLLSWADSFRKLGVWANADYPKDAKKALEFGAEGIGLCRTEHMFFEKERRPLVVRMIMATDENERRRLLDQLLPFQRRDFEGIFEVMRGRPVIIRLIDPPMHEFLPPKEDLIEEVTRLQLGKGSRKELEEKEKMLKVVENMWEINPMLGLRGCRTGIVFPEIFAMQVRAIFEAACRVAKRGIDVYPKIEIPLTSHVNEFKVERESLEKVAKKVMEEEKVKIKYEFGTMIETPRAAIVADGLAKEAQFFSFGTNDLTQMTFGISRDDAEGKFLLKYVEEGILPQNPFQVLDREGVGELMKMAVEKGRGVKADLEIGICGEHGGDPSSIEFCHKIGLDYVSCSPFRVPVARLAAAQAVLRG